MYLPAGYDRLGDYLIPPQEFVEDGFWPVHVLYHNVIDFPKILGILDEVARYKEAGNHRLPFADRESDPYLSKEPLMFGELVRNFPQDLAQKHLSGTNPSLERDLFRYVFEYFHLSKQDLQQLLRIQTSLLPEDLIEGIYDKEVDEVVLPFAHGAQERLELDYPGFVNRYTVTTSLNLSEISEKRIRETNRILFQQGSARNPYSEIKADGPYPGDAVINLHEQLSAYLLDGRFQRGDFGDVTDNSTLALLAFLSQYHADVSRD